MAAGEVRARWFFRQIIADEHGLRWQESWGRDWQEATWEAVTDFYFERSNPEDATISPLNIICFQDERILTFSASWSNYKQLHQCIAAHSANAETARLPDGTIGWAMRGTRPADLPASFSYSSEVIGKLRKRFHQAIFLHSSLFVLLTVYMIVIAIVAGPSMLLLLYPIILYGCYVAAKLLRKPKRERRFREAEGRAARSERFEATQDALNIWQDGEKQVVHWSDIIGYDLPRFINYPDDDTVRIRTVSGKEFSFTSLMTGAVLFVETLPRYAHDAVLYRRGRNEKEAIGGITLRWTGGEEGKGNRIFHQRTRYARRNLFRNWVVCLSLVLYCGAAFLSFMLYALSRSDISHILLWFLGLFVVGGATGAVVTLVRATRRYYCDRVIVCKQGLQVIIGGKETDLSWQDIVHHQSDRWKIYLTHKDGAILTLDIFRYAYGNELPDLIRENMERARVEAERKAISAADVAQPPADMRVWNQEASIEREPQKVMRKT